MMWLQYARMAQVQPLRRDLGGDAGLEASHAC
jgi:hypothetical protein